MRFVWVRHGSLRPRSGLVGHTYAVRGEFWLKRQANGRGYFARVQVALSDAPYPSVLLGPGVFEAVHDAYGPAAYTDSRYFDALRNGALSGAIYALHRANAARLVTVERVDGSSVDTDEDSVRFATAFAVWDALGATPDHVPTLDTDEHRFDFPHPPQ